MRYFYKKPDGSAYWSLKSPSKPKGSVEITEKEFNDHVKELEEKTKK